MMKAQNRFFLFLLLSGGTSHAFVDTFFNVGSGDWNVASNWTPATLPTNSNSGGNGSHMFLRDNQTITVPASTTANVWVSHIGGRLASDGALNGSATVIVEAGAVFNNFSTSGAIGDDFRMGRDAAGDGTGMVSRFINNGGTVSAHGFRIGGYEGDDVNAQSYYVQNSGSSTFQGTSRLGASGHGTMILNSGTISITSGGSAADPRLAVGYAGTSTGYLEINGGTLNLGNGVMNIAHEGNAVGTVLMTGGNLVNVGQLNVGDDGAAVMTQSGGVVSINSFQMVRGLGTNGVKNGPRTAVYNLSNGSFSANSSLLGTRGDATFNMSGGTFDSGSSLNIRHSSASTAADQTIFNQTGGSVFASTLNFDNGGGSGNGTYNLEGGSLSVDTINLNGNTFNWGNATLTVRQPIGSSGSTDFSQAIGPTVQAGTTLTYNGDLDSGFNGGTSSLDLGGVYLNGGVRQNVMQVNGNLDLADDDALIMGGSAYLLRPFGFYTEDYGTIPLVSVTGTLTGGFDSFLAPASDGKGWDESAFSVSNPADLDVNTWYLEQTASGVFFHYKVQGAVPEPSTLGLLLAGGLFLRRIRKAV